MRVDLFNVDTFIIEDENGKQIDSFQIQKASIKDEKSPKKKIVTLTKASKKVKSIIN